MAQSQPQSQAYDSLSLRSGRLTRRAGATLGGRGPDRRRRRRATKTPTTALGGELTARRQRSLWGDAWRRLIRNKLAIIGLVIVTTFTLIAIFAPLIAPYGQAEVVDYRLARFHPSWTWPMGLDANGRDIFSRMVYGARVSLVVGVLAQAIVLLIGVPIGAIAGYYGGETDNVLMRSST